MRYLILRRNFRIALLLILLATIIASVIPWVYSRFFIDREDLAGPGLASHKFKLQDFFRQEEIDDRVSLNVSFLDNGYLSSELHVEGLEIKGFTASGNIFVKGRFVKDKDSGQGAFAGRLFSRDIIINSNQLMPVNASFKVTGDELEIRSLCLGRAYRLKGKIGLNPPFKTDLRLNIERADIKDLVMLAKTKRSGIALGLMNGVFYVKGELFNLYSNGILESRNGRMGRIDYDVATIRVEGFGPIINIVDSKARWGKSLLAIEGYIDLRNLEKGNLFEGLRIKSDMKTIVWDGWDINQKGKDELSMSKDISDRMRVGFKAFAREPLTPYKDGDSLDEMSLEYKIGVEHLKMRLKENEEFFGIEHSVKF